MKPMHDSMGRPHQRSLTKRLSATELSDPRAQQVCAALDAFLTELEARRAPQIDEWLARHADIADTLREQLDSLLLLQGAADDSMYQSVSESDPIGGINEPRMIGPFRLQRELGRGGMGIVYDAIDTTLGRRVALKLLPFAAVLNHKQLARFQNEAQAASRLHHVNIVPVYSIGCDRGMHYYAMQYVDGQSLEDAIEELSHPSIEQQTSPSTATRPWRLSAIESPLRSDAFFRKVAEMGRDVASGLQHAHELGILHRDIKPSNLLLDQDGKVWVTDFGLARLPGELAITRTGEVLGSVRYMSPEQAAGRNGFVDHRTDIYSLGITLYELVTLRPAFPVESREQFMHQVQAVDPPLPRKWNPAIPLPLQAIICKATEKSPSRRYATAEEFAVDLQRYLNAQATHAEQNAWRLRLRRLAFRHRVVLRFAAILCGLACLGTTIGGALVWRYYNIAKTEYQRAEGNLHAILDWTGSSLSRTLSKLQAVPGTEPFIREELAQRLAMLDKVKQQNVHSLGALVQQAEIQSQIGSIQEQLDDLPAARQAFDAAASIYRDLLARSPDHPAYRLGLIRAVNSRALILAGLGSVQSGYEDIQWVVAELRDLTRKESADMAVHRSLCAALGNQALILADLHRTKDAIVSLEEGKRRLDACAAIAMTDGEWTQQMAIFAYNLSSLYATIDPSRSQRLVQESIDLQRSLVDQFPDSIAYRADLALSHHHLGTLLLKSDDVAGAKSQFVEAVRQATLAVSRAPTIAAYQDDLATFRNNLGRTCLALGDARQAISQFDLAAETLELQMKQRGRRPELLSSLAGIRFNLGLARRQLHGHRAGLDAIQKAIELQQEACHIAPHDQQLADQLSLLKKYADSQQVDSPGEGPALAGSVPDREVP